MARQAQQRAAQGLGGCPSQGSHFPEIKPRMKLHRGVGPGEDPVESGQDRQGNPSFCFLGGVVQYLDDQTNLGI